MSTKIYSAFRLRAGHQLWPTVERIRRRAEINVQKVLVPLYSALTAGEDILPIGKLSDEERSSWHSVSRAVLQAYQDQTVQSQRNGFDLDVTISFRRVGRRWLLIPYAGSGLFSRVLDFLARDRGLEDFCYFNNSDRPKTVHAAAWAARRRTWAKVLNGRWRDQLVLQIVTPHGWFSICPAFNSELRGRRSAWS